MSEGVDPIVRRERARATGLLEFFAYEPGVGFAIVDRLGLIRFVNARSAEIFLGVGPEHALGKNVWDLFDDGWVAERMGVFEQMLRHGRPVLFRHICRGRRVQSTVRLLPVADGQPPALSIVTVEGKHDPADASEFETIESVHADFGPLSSLSRRELEVLALLGHGMTANQIGEALFRSPRTIEKHLDSLRTKLGNLNRVQLARYAKSAGLTLEAAELRRTRAALRSGVEPDPAEGDRP
jgi:DNA-binding CsgD family transcriptional regulator